VIRDSAGNLYGTTQLGGAANLGVVYKLDTTGHETVLHSFTGGADGAGPTAGVIGDSGGNLYGTTGGGGVAGMGVVYKLDSTGQETVLYAFTGVDAGYEPNGVILDSAGNLYGTTTYGGNTSNCGNQFQAGCGMVYKLDTTGKLTVLYSFIGPGGGYPVGGVIRDSAGNLFGTTSRGGKQSNGVLFELKP